MDAKIVYIAADGDDMIAKFQKKFKKVPTLLKLFKFHFSMQNSTRMPLELSPYLYLNRFDSNLVIITDR